MKKIFIIVLFLFSAGYVFAENTGFTISGKIENIKTNAPVYIFLVDKETSKIPFTGVKETIIKPDPKAVESGSIEFLFTDVPEGKYGIRCFQDTNGNAKLDKGLFGPKEPWGLSWNENKTFKWPSFRNFCFSLTQNINNIVIKLKK